MKSRVQQFFQTHLAHPPSLNAMKSGVQRLILKCSRRRLIRLNAMKSGVRLCGDFNFGDVKRCLKEMKSGVMLKKKFKGGSRRY